MKRWKAPLAAAVVFASIGAVSLVFWIVDEGVEQRFLTDQTQFAALEFRERVTGYVSDRLRSAASLQDVWSPGAEDVESEFVARATSLVNTFGGVLAVNWIDPDGYIRWVAPREPNIDAIDRNLFENPNAAPSIRAADSTGEMRITPPLELYQGGRGFAAYLPLERQGARRGFINVVFRSDALLDGAIRDDHFLRGFDLWLVAGGGSVFSLSIDTADAYTAISASELGNTTFTAIAQPNGATLAAAESRLGELIMVLGLMLAALAGAVAFALIRSRERLAGTLEHLRATLEAVPDLHLVIGPNSTIVDVQPPGSFPGIDPGDISGKTIGDLFTADVAARVEAEIAKVRRGEPSNFEYSQDHEDSVRWLEARILPMGDSLLLMIARDVTARKHAENEQRELELQLLRTQKLESLGVLAGGIAHDFNNILTSIMGNAELARESAAADATSLPHLTQIANSAERAAELCNQMLAYSGKGQFTIEPVDLSRMVCEVREILGASLSKKVDVEYDLESGMPSVEADVAQLRQVAMNLVVNAAESMGDQRGSVLVATSSLYCGAEALRGSYLHGTLDPGEYVCLEVTDDGPGMDETTQSRAFEPFFTTKAAGRGLGLASVLGIVRSHGGTLSVRSKPGRGTTFMVLLPVATDQDPAPAPAPEAIGDPKAGRGSVLVVDDEESVLELAVSMVGKLGYRPLRAANGNDALELVRQGLEPIDAVLLDVTMPDLNGLEVLDEIRTVRPELPVILTSGYSEFDSAANPNGIEHSAFLHKPYRMATLAALLRDVTGSADGGNETDHGAEAEEPVA